MYITDMRYKKLTFWDFYILRYSQKFSCFFVPLLMNSNSLRGGELTPLVGLNFTLKLLSVLVILIFLPQIGHSEDMLSFDLKNGSCIVSLTPEKEVDFGVIKENGQKHKTIILHNETEHAIKFKNWNSPSGNIQFSHTISLLPEGGKKEIIITLNGNGCEGVFTKQLCISFKNASLNSSDATDYYLPVKFEVSDKKANLIKPANKEKFQIQNDNVLRYLDFEIWKTPLQKINNPDSAAWIFSSHNCPACNYLKKEVFPAFFKQNNISFPREIITVDLTNRENLLFYIALEKALKAEGTKAPILYWKGNLYYGTTAIKLILKQWKDDHSKHDEISVFLKNYEDRVVHSSEMIIDKSKTISTWAILAAGFIDGMNPCVFTTLVFLVSMLSLAGITGKRIILTGVVYCSAVFLTYLFMGFGILKILNVFSSNLALRNIINTGLILILFILAVLSFRDAYKFCITGKAEDISLKLSGKMINVIHIVIRKSLRYKFFIPSVFMMGIGVTVIESACTGQIYLPILSYMVMETETQGKCFFLLVLYNIMFIVPLVVVFAAVYIGTGATFFRNIANKHIVIVKTGMGLFFLLLAYLMFQSF